MENTEKLTKRISVLVDAKLSKRIRRDLILRSHISPILRTLLNAFIALYDSQGKKAVVSIEVGEFTLELKKNET